MTEPRVDVLLAAFNGARFLREQIASIMAQSYRNLRVLAHDDGSTDGTLEILADAEARDPERFVVCRDGKVFGSACRNFLHLLSLSDSAFVTFADQDDVWSPERIGAMVAALGEEQGAPLGVYSDLEVVDESMRPIAPSLWALQGTPDWISRSVQTLAVGNCVTGCAFMFNATARRQILARRNERAVMHDHFAALCILADGGTLVALETCLVRYRQHGQNEIGAVRMISLFDRRRIGRLRRDLHGFFRNYQQARQVGLDVSLVRFAWWHVRVMIRRRSATGPVRSAHPLVGER